MRDGTSRRAFLGILRPADPRVDASACLARTGCCVCAERCPLPAAIAWAADAIRIDPQVCDRCGVCLDVCPAPTPCIVLQ